MQRTIKRSIDVIVSATCLVVLSPLLLLLAILIMIDSRGPVLYVTERLGQNARHFRLYKFRTMYENSQPRYQADGTMLVEQRDPRVTRMGRFLRLGFDELPQLWNVLRGDMSLIGPRPDLPYGLDLYQGNEAMRLTVKPGITGLAQVKGRTRIPWRERLAYDIQYVEQYSLRLDAKIAFLTIFELFPPLKHLWPRS